MQFFPTAVCNVTAWRHSRLRAHWLMALVVVLLLKEKYVYYWEVCISMYIYCIEVCILYCILKEKYVEVYMYILIYYVYKYVYCIPGIAASLISLLSMGGVCGWSLTAGKILFTGRQTWSLYLVLWLCDLQVTSGGLIL